jgi:hypothetical protein
MLSNLPGRWEWELRGDMWWRVLPEQNIEDGPHDKPRCHVCRRRITIDPYGGSGAWVHLQSLREHVSYDHEAVA